MAIKDCKEEKPLTSEYVATLVNKNRAAPAEVVRALVGAIQRGDKGFASGAKAAARPSKTAPTVDADAEGD